MCCTEQRDSRERSYLGLTYNTLAQRVGSSEQRVADICTGKAKPTTKEFNDLASTLGVSPPRDAVHATWVEIRHYYCILQSAWRLQ
ncbi:hypothetical protein EDB83DRAFT_148948 [Lactarius deliciosus]|nr:hypothetical protein EDB83DRAFT_148948 [Lactarius deliciosus]